MMNYIRDQLSDEELLAQLAEEATELAHAALKMRRVMDGKNPTPVRISEAWAKLQEEVADVLLSLQVLDINTNDQEYQETIWQKLNRWVSRLQQAERGEFDE